MSNAKTQYDGVNCLGAGLITAVGGHVLLCAAALPKLFSMPHDGVVAVIAKVLLLLWTALGIPAGAFVIMKTTGIFNGRSYAEARRAAIGTMILSVVGTPGLVTAFALIPAGALALYLLNRPSWKAVFAEFAPVQPVEEPVDEPSSEEIEEVLREAEASAELQEDLARR